MIFQGIFLFRLSVLTLIDTFMIGLHISSSHPSTGRDALVNSRGAFSFFCSSDSIVKAKLP